MHADMAKGKVASIAALVDGRDTKDVNWRVGMTAALCTGAINDLADVVRGRDFDTAYEAFMIIRRDLEGLAREIPDRIAKEIE